MIQYPYTDDKLVSFHTYQWINRGKRIFEIHKLSNDDSQHIDILLNFLEPKENASILDAGCGTGEVARLMEIERSDLKFTLLNCSKSQLTLCPQYMNIVCSDYHHMPFKEAAFDIVMFLYSMGNGSLEILLREANKVLKVGGHLFVYDIFSLDISRSLVSLNYSIYTLEDFDKYAKVLNFNPLIGGYVRDSYISDILEVLSVEEFNTIFKYTAPAIVKYRKVKNAWNT